MTEPRVRDDDVARFDGARSLAEAALRLGETGEPGDRLRLLANRQRPKTYAGVRIGGQGCVRIELWDTRYRIRATYFNEGWARLRYDRDQRPIDIAHAGIDVLSLLYRLLAADFRPVWSDERLQRIVESPAGRSGVRHVRTVTGGRR